MVNGAVTYAFTEDCAEGPGILELRNHVVVTDAIGEEHIVLSFIVRDNPNSITNHVDLPNEFLYPVLAIRDLIAPTKH